MTMSPPLEPLPFSSRPPCAIAQRVGQVLHSSQIDGILALAQELDSTDTGCYVALWRLVKTPVPHWAPVCGLMVGDVPTEKSYKYVAIGNEKAHRLAMNPKHDLSFQTWDVSDPANPKYPGAVRMDLDGIIISTSGLDWKFDELFGHFVGSNMGLISSVNLARLIELSDNEHARRYFHNAA